MIRLIALSLLSQVMLQDEGGTAAYVKKLNCQGGGVVCTALSGTGSIFIGADAGSTAAGLPNLSVQYNNGGPLGGADNVFIDGGNLGLIGLPAHPVAPPATNHAMVYNWLAQTGMPVQPMHIDNTLALPVPEGTLNLFSLLGTTANWRVTGCLVQGFGTAAWTEVGDIGNAQCGGSGGSCTSTSPVWAATNLETRSPTILGTTTNASNIWCGDLYTTVLQFWRGNAAGAGGFLWWHRHFIDQAANDGLAAHRMFIGVISRTSIITSTAEPNTFGDTAYFGGTTGQTSINVCSNDNVGSATCVDLGSNYPSTTGAWYDFYIWAKPNDTQMYYGIVRLDSAQATTGSFNSGDLPRNTVQLGWQALIGTGAGSDAGVVKTSTGGTLVLWNY